MSMKGQGITSLPLLTAIQSGLQKVIGLDSETAVRWTCEERRGS